MSGADEQAQIAYRRAARAKKARKKLAKARDALGHDLSGFSVVDFLADNFPWTLAECRAIAEILASTEQSMGITDGNAQEPTLAPSEKAAPIAGGVAAPGVSRIDAMHPEWRNQIVGHTLRAGELTFSDVAALLEAMAGGGYPYKIDDNRVAIRIAIVARAAELLRVGTELQAMVNRYASECGECDGFGNVFEPNGDSTACPDCADIRAVRAKVKP